MFNEPTVNAAILLYLRSFQLELKPDQNVNCSIYILYFYKYFTIKYKYFYWRRSHRSTNCNFLPSSSSFPLLPPSFFLRTEDMHGLMVGPYPWWTPSPCWNSYPWGIPFPWVSLYPWPTPYPWPTSYQWWTPIVHRTIAFDAGLYVEAVSSYFLFSWS